MDKQPIVATKIKAPEKNENSKDLTRIAELIKSEGIGQVVIHGREIYKEGKKTDDLAFHSDIDAKMAITLLNDFNITSPEKLYTEGAVSSIIPMGGSEKNLDYKNKKGVRIFLDVGGEWMKVEEKSGKTTTIFIDHHGSGRREPTSATKMVYDILEKGDLLKEKQPWLKDCVNFVNDIDNLSYLERKNTQGEKIFNEEYFIYKWPRTPYALAGEMPLEKVIELFKSGKIKDGMQPFTSTEIETGEIGKIKVKGIDFNGKPINKTIKEIALEKQKQAIFNSNAIRRSKQYADTNGLNMKMKSFQGKDLEMIFHDFPKIVNTKGKEYQNKFINNMAYLSAKAQGYGGIIVWNPKKMDKRFFVNIDSPEMERIGKELNEVAPGTTEVRGTFIFPPKDSENVRALTKEQFLNIISPKILENAIIIKSGIKKNKGEGKLVLNEEEEKEAVEEEKIETRTELIDEKNEEGQLETKVGKPVDTKELAEKAIEKNPELNPELAQKEAKNKIEKSIKNELEEKERKIRLDNEAILQIGLDEARLKYAEAYKKFMTERKQKAGFFTRIKRKVLGETVPDEEVPEDLKKLEDNYTKAATLYGQGMYENMAKELSLSDLPEEKQKELLEHFRQSGIFNKVVIEEEEKLTALKAENLPPKEKALWKKGLDWYIKQNRFTKVAISTVLSTAVIATFLPSMMVAGGVTAGYLATKFGRGIIGGVIGQLAAKGYDIAVKEKHTKRKEIALEELKKKFGNKMSEEDLLKYKKEYAEILEKERISKRNRLIHKAGIAMITGGVAAYGTGHLAQAFSTPNAPTDIPLDTKNISPEHIFKTEEVQFSSKGAIQTIQNLKTKISADYPDLSKAPHSVQEFMKTNSTEEAIRLGFYNPNSTAESAMIMKGSTLSFDEHGNLSYHDIKTGETHNLINEQNNTETIEKYHEKMFDSDHSGNTPRTGIDNGHPIKIDGAADDLMNQKPIDINGASSNDLTHQTPIKIDGPETGNLNNQQPIKIDGATSSTLEQTQSTSGSNNLTTEQLAELAKTTKITYEDNINKMFPNEQKLQIWNSVKNSSNLHPAEQFISWDKPVNENMEGLVSHMKTLYAVTKLPSTIPGTYPPIQLTAEEYITRATQKAAEMGPGYLEKIKYVEPLNNIVGDVELNNTTTNPLEQTVDIEKIHPFKFENPDHIISITENNSSLRMQFIYNSDGKIVGESVNGSYYTSNPKDLYENMSELRKLPNTSRIDASYEISKMTNLALFLDKLPHDTYEYKFIYDKVVEMQKNIIKDYGNVINPDKIVN